MKKLIGLIVILVFGLVACNLEDLTKKKDNKKEQVASCATTKFGQCTTVVEGQIYYSVSEILNDSDYILGAFKIYLIGEEHAYLVEPDEDGNFNQSIEAGEYTLVAYYRPDNYESESWVYDTSYDEDFNFTIEDGLIGGLMDINFNLYQLGKIKSNIDLTENTNFISLDLINPERLYIEASTGKVITTTDNSNDSNTANYANDKIEKYFERYN